MAITIPGVAETRGAMVQAYREALVALLTDATKDVPSGAWEGVPVITAKDANEALDAVFGQPVPMPSETTAEVHTPAKVIVSAICPKCYLPGAITLEITSQLLVENTISGELKLKAKAKARTHVCGQLALPDASDDEAEGQQSFELEDIVGRDLDVETVLDALELIAYTPLPAHEIVDAWSQATRRQVAEYAGAVHLRASDHDDVVVPPLPRVLGGFADPGDDADDESAD